MNLIGTALAVIYVVVATRSASATSREPGGSAGTGGVEITCKPGAPTNSTVSHPDTTVKVTCPDTPSTEGVSRTPGYSVYVDANCSQPGEPSKVCPGATVSPAPEDGVGAGRVEDKDTTPGTIVTLRFPQLPASQQVVCVECLAKPKSDENCKALITVAAASPQGPQACAVAGTSITLEINKAGGSAQFRCGEDRTLVPTDPTKAYADDCSTVETLTDMTRGEKSDSGYLTVKVDKLKKKKLCYLCQRSASGRRQKGEQDDSCKVYVKVSGSTKFSSTVPYGLALPCLAAVLRFT